MPNSIKVVLADESATTRLLLASLLEEDGRFEVIADVSSGAAAIARRADADLVVVDLVLEDADAFSVIDDLRAVAPELPVVIVAAVDPPYLRHEAEARGAAGFFRHTADPTALLDGLAEVARGTGA